MKKFLFLLISFVLLSCNNEKSKNKIIKNIKKTTKHDIIFSEKEKSHYIKKKQIEIKFKSVNKLFNRINKKIIIIKSKLDFESFTNLPPYYKKLFNKKELTFALPAILIDEKHLLSNYDILKVSKNIFIKDSNINLKIKGFDEDLNISVLESEKKINNNIVKIISKKKFAGEHLFSIGVINSKEKILKRGIINIIHYSQLYESIDSYFSQSLSSISNISSMVFDKAGDFIGIISNYDPYYKYSSYIVSSNILLDVLEKLKKGYQTSSKSWIGLKFKESLNLVIYKIVKDSPADIAKFKIKDKLLEINNIKLKNKKHLKEILSFIKPQTKITLKVKRNKKILKINLKTMYKPLN